MCKPRFVEKRPYNCLVSAWLFLTPIVCSIFVLPTMAVHRWKCLHSHWYWFFSIYTEIWLHILTKAEHFEIWHNMSYYRVMRKTSRGGAANLHFAIIMTCELFNWRFWNVHYTDYALAFASQLQYAEYTVLTMSINLSKIIVDIQTSYLVFLINRCSLTQ